MKVLQRVVFLTLGVTCISDVCLSSALGKVYKSLPIEELPLFIPPIEDVARGMIVCKLHLWTKLAHHC